MKLFMDYLKYRARLFAMLAVFCVFFTVSFLLYRLPLGAVLYPTAVCAALGILCLMRDFSLTRKKHRELMKLKELNASMLFRIPRAGSVGEADCHELIESLRAEVFSLESEAEARYRDMVEYYTAWAHQIKTPIAAMNLTLQGSDTPLSMQLRGELMRIEHYADMVMAFLRLESTASDYVFRRHELDGIVRQAVRRFAPEFINRKISLEYEPIEESAVTDEKWLCFVLEQIISNALKYTYSGSVKIYMSEGETLCVEDTGIGIAQEDLPRIFEKGYTGSNGRFDKRASGLGLYLCKRICDNLSIDIKARSQLGKGTTISLNLAQYELGSNLTKM